MALKHKKPNTALMAELMEVADAARELDDRLKVTNWLPENFEHEALIAMLNTLWALPKGTAFVAQVNLRAGKAELQNIEETYFKTDAEVTKNTADNEANFLQRRSDFGRTIIVLKGTIETALSECRKQAQTLETDDVAPEDEHRTDNVNNPARPELDERLQSIEQYMDFARGEVDTLFVKNAPSREPLLRIIQDTENISRMSRAIAALNSASNWVWMSLGKALKSAPNAMIKVMNGVKTTNEIARPLTKRFNDFQTDLTNFGHDQIDKTANAFIESADIANEKLNSTPPPVDPEVQKAAEAEAEKLLKQNKPVPDDVALNVRTLDLMNSGFMRVDLLGNIKWLLSVELSRTKITDFTPLSKLRNLIYLNLEVTKILDLAPLSELIKLQSLILTRTQITDLTPIHGLKNLLSLNLLGVQVKDFTPIAGLKKLQWLYLASTGITNLEPLSGLENLQSLNLEVTWISNLTPLSGLTQLQSLSLAGSEIADLKPIMGLNKLRTLFLDDTRVTDLVSVGRLTELRSLYLNYTQIKDLAPIGGLKNLNKLSLNGTQITDWAPVAHIKDVPGRPKYWDQ